MRLAEREKRFLERRGALVRSWPIVGSVCLLGILVFSGWLWMSRPLLINPWAVAAGLEEGSIPESTTVVMAAMLPLTVLCCLLLLIVCIVFCFAAFSNERKHLAIIRRLGTSQGTSDEGS